MITVAVVVLSSFVMTQGVAGHPTSELVGLWHGTSTCTKADWNAACHDEEAVYDVRPGQAPGHLLLHGYRIVADAAVFMGDLDFAWDDEAKAWKAEFVGPRVRSRWLFEVDGDSLTGKAVLLPDLRVGRTIRLDRHRGPSPWTLNPDP